MLTVITKERARARARLVLVFFPQIVHVSSERRFSLARARQQKRTQLKKNKQQPGDGKNEETRQNRTLRRLTATRREGADVRGSG